MLELNNVVISYGSHTVIDHLNLRLDEGRIHGIVGLNGSGKTTLFNALYGHKREDDGEILWQGDTLYRAHIAYMETHNFFYPRITGREYLDLFRVKNPDFSLEKWNALFELPLNDLIETYSTGMKKKLAFMGILATNRPLLLLDEPFNGVDLESNRKIIRILKTLKGQGKTLIVTSHILESLTGLCDTISYLNGGKIEFTFEQPDFDRLESEVFATREAEEQRLIDEAVG